MTSPHQRTGTDPVRWTITAGVEHPDLPGELFWEVNGDGGDTSNPRHWPDRYAAISFVITHHMKRGDTLHMAGADTGRILRVGLVKIGETIEFDVGTRQIPNPAELIDWLDTTLQPGDTVNYLPYDT